MRNISTFNKLFLILCAVVIVFLALTVPHESDDLTISTVQETEAAE